MNIKPTLPDLKIFYLRPGTKFPDGRRFPHGHKDAIPAPNIIKEDYGIRLNDQWVVVDVDKPELCDRDFPLTWSQGTKKGVHMLYKQPPGFVGRSGKLRNATGEIYGDLKCDGYIVGPGSTVADHVYAEISGLDPIMCPADLLEQMHKAAALENEHETGEERKGIPHGEHDQSLVQIAGWLRHKFQFDEPTIARFLEKGPLAVLQDMDPERPYTREDLKRIAHQMASKSPGPSAELSLSPVGWESYTEIDTSMPLNEWWIYRFIPKGELVMLYGKGGIGKSSFASYLASEVIKSGKTMGFAGIEEPFLRFATRAALAVPDASEANLSGIINIGSQWQFPRDANAFREALLVYPLDLVYFDSIYGHFEAVEGLNTAERARHCLAPLATIAQELGVTIVCTFHENKAGDFLGSVEMVNVARIVLHATREKDKDLKMEVKKTNFTEPDHKLSFGGTLLPGRSRSGEPWEEVDENGNVIPLELFVIQNRRKSTGEDEQEEDPRWAEIMKLKDAGSNQSQIAVALGIPRTTVQEIIKREGKIKYITHIEL